MKSVACLVVLYLLAILLAEAKNHNVTDMIKGYGYPCEDHLTEPTSDGWKLSLQRIPYGKNGRQGPPKGVVFFQHGLTDNSAGVNLNGPVEGLSFILADAGYDVWLGNNRGNGISMENIYYKPHEKSYWDWSWDEMASIDLPTNIQYVLNYTGAQQLTYIGHSEGTIQAFAGFIINPDLAEKVNLYVALAPVAYVQYVESLIIVALADLDVDEIFVLLGDKEFILDPGVIKLILPGVCAIDPSFCKFSIDLVCGPTTFFNKSREDYYLKYEPNPTSVKNMVHWSQGVKSGTFQMFDYGKQGNIEHYNQPVPPQYNLELFPKTLNTALFAGGQDYLADPKDVERLLALLPTPPFVHYEPKYAHLDPLIGTNAYQRIYPLILNMIAQAWNGTLDAAVRVN